MPTPPGGAAVADQYIETQLNRTRRDVKLVDLSGSLMVLGAAAVGVLLVLAIVDHWILPLSVWVRWAMFAGILVAAAWYLATAILPLAIGRINPIYAARTIEQNDTSLKNSLVNYLLFREDRAGLRAGIYEALKQRAAADLSHVPIESAVDRTRLIRIGYGLALILTLFAAYTILSPKNPLQTARRVMLPWADIAPPTRVRIEEIAPGDQQVYHGDQVQISALCYDLRLDEPVTLFYSSLDGRISDQSIRLEPNESQLRYGGTIPPNPEGIQQDLIYRIEAGDAVTSSYRLTVVPAPALLVQQIEYDYPSYTSLPNRIVERQGDVRGIEGTRVTVRAQANQPIRWATIVLDPPLERNGSTDASAESTNDNGASTLISMQFDGQQAWGTFPLELHPNSLRPKHSAYLLRFETDTGQTNSRAPVYRIEVTRDLTPEIEILTPAKPRIELPLDRRQPIEVRAVDPDYGLTEIQLRAVAGGADLLTETLLQDTGGRIGQVVTTYQFEPWKHGLRPGDALTFWAVASDNRVSPATGQSEPNVARTGTYHVTIIPPENPSTGSPEPTLADPSEDPNAPPSEPKQSPAAGADPDGAPDQTGTSDRPDESEGQSGDSADPSDSQSSNDQASDGAGQSAAGAGQSSPSTGDSGSSSQDAGGSMGDSAGSGASDASSGTESSDQPGASSGSDAGTQAGSGGNGQESPASSAGDGASSRPGDGGGVDDPTRSSSGGAAEASGQEASGDEPLHDGEVIERTLEHIKSQRSAQASDQSTDAQAGDPSGQAGDPSGQAGDPSGQADGSEPGASGETGDDRGAGQQQDGAAGQSGQPQGPASAEPESGQQDSSGSEPKPGGMGQDGQSGAGQENQEQAGAPSSDKQNADRPKQGDSGSAPQQPSEDAQSSTQSSQQSDSQSDSQGDQSGGGEQGGVQGSQQQGHDSSGSQSAADQGSGAAEQSGAGDSSPRPGSQQTADDPANTPGTQKGDGSSTQPAPGGRGPGASADGSTETQTAERPDGQPTPGDAEHQGQGLPMGGGRPGEVDPADSPMAGEVPTGDEPNLEYAKRNTDMVLDYLRDQQQKPDPDLLQQLRWTEDDLRQFLNRWEQLQRSAADDQRGQRDLNDALRSLGLRPDQQSGRRVTAPTDPVTRLRETGVQSNPPARYLEQFNAYRKGTARADE